MGLLTEVTHGHRPDSWLAECLAWIAHMPFLAEPTRTAVVDTMKHHFHHDINHNWGLGFAALIAHELHRYGCRTQICEMVLES